MVTYIYAYRCGGRGRDGIKEQSIKNQKGQQGSWGYGYKNISQYAILGPYDFINILEAPDNNPVSKMGVELEVKGTLQTMAMAAMLIDEFIW